MSQTGQQPPSTRSCSGCTLCCKALAIKELNKPTGVACRHLSGGGCGVQEERPGNDIYFGCNTYNCLWLLGDLEEKDRPDKIKAVFSAIPHPNPSVARLMILVNEAFAGSSDSGRARELIDGFIRMGYTIVVKNPQYSTEYYPDGNVVRFRIDAKDPMLMKYDPAIRPIQLRVGGRFI